MIDADFTAAASCKCHFKGQVETRKPSDSCQPFRYYWILPSRLIQLIWDGPLYISRSNRF